MRLAHVFRRVCVGSAIWLAASGAAVAQTTAFLYQGKLNDAGSPANGAYDLKFVLFTGLAGGMQIGAPIVADPVTVTAGAFGVTLDFGADVFDGNDRFLEVSVRPSGSAAGYVALAPRQPILSSPYTIQTINTQKLGGLPANRYLASDGNGRFGIGTAAPTAPLEVNGNVRVSGIGNGYIFPDGSLQTTASAGGGGLAGAGTANAVPLWTGAASLGNSVIQQANGNIGIGTASPGSKLHVVSGQGANPPRLESPGAGDYFSAGLDFYHGATGKGYVGVPDSTAFFGADEMILFGGTGTKTSLWAGQTRGLTMGTDGHIGMGTDPDLQKQLAVLDTAGYTVAVSGTSNTGWGVSGVSDSSIGVYGKSTSGTGVYGTTNVGSINYAGVYGVGTGVSSIGVIGESNSYNSVGVFGVSADSLGFGVYGRNLAGGRAMYAEGNAGQDRFYSGWVKAMLFINATGNIVRCYNSQTNSTTPPCGFSVSRAAGSGFYDVGFGFQVDDRFVATQAFNNPFSGGCAGGLSSVDLPAAGSTFFRVITYCQTSPTDKPFIIFVF